MPKGGYRPVTIKSVGAIRAGEPESDEAIGELHEVQRLVPYRAWSDPLFWHESGLSDEELW